MHHAAGESAANAALTGSRILLLLRMVISRFPGGGRQHIPLCSVYLF